MFEYYPYFSTPQFETYYPSVDTFGIALTLFFVIAFCLLVVGSIYYILFSFGLYRIAENRNMKGSFLALLPLVNIYYIGKVADDIDRTMNKNSNSAVKLLILAVASFLLGVMSIPFCFIFIVLNSYFLTSLAYISLLIGAVVAICFFVYFYSALYKIYKEYIPDSALICEVFSILFFIFPIILFVIREKKSGYSIWLENKGTEKKADAGYDFPANGYDEKPVKQETDADVDADDNTDGETETDTDTASDSEDVTE